MVKIQKTISKTIKNGSPELKKAKAKIVKTKEIPKKVQKTLAVVDENEVNDKVKGGVLNKKKDALLQLHKINETVLKKKPLKNNEAKKTPALQEVSELVEKIDSKKKKNAVSKQKLIKNGDAINSALDVVTTTAKKSAQKKKPVESKVQQIVKNSVDEKSSALEEEFENIKNVTLKKKQHVEKVKKPVTTKVQNEGKPTVTLEEESKKIIPKKKQTKAKVQQDNKKPFAKKNSALEMTPEDDENELAPKKSSVAKDQQPTKKNVTKKDVALAELSETVKNVNPKKKVTGNILDAEKKSGKNLVVNDKAGKEPLQKKLKSKVQKNLSAKKKNETNLKNKVRKNISEVEKILHKEKEKLPMFEPENFDEDKFKDIVSLENVTKILNALKTVVKNEVSKKKNTVFDDYTYFLNVASYKIPNCPRRMVKLNLKHSLVDAKVDGIALFVPDLKRGAKVDYEPTIQHYDDILRESGIENIKVLPFNQLRNEYTSYEAKIKLSNLYDYFMCDGRIVGQVVGFCGKHFQKPRTTIHAVNLSNPKKFKSEIERALKRTAYRQLQKGDLSSILVGNHRFSTEQLAENIETIIHQLKTNFAGGYANIRNIHIKTDIPGTSSLPLYVSLSGPPDEVPNIIGPREQRMLQLKKQANDILSKFNITKTGDFVKLNKEQIKRKQQLHETREALTSKENIKGNEDAAALNPPSKKKLKKQVEHLDYGDSEASDNINGGDDQESEEKSDDNGDDGEESEDDEDVGEESEDDE